MIMVGAVGGRNSSGGLVVDVEVADLWAVVVGTVDPIGVVVVAGLQSPSRRLRGIWILWWVRALHSGGGCQEDGGLASALVQSQSGATLTVV